MVKTEIRVIYGDTDQMGVVYYANYLRFFEAGRNEFLRARGARYRDVERSHRLFLPVVEVGVTYKKPGRYDDLLIIETDLVKTGRASARFEYRVMRQDELIASGHTVHACVDFDGKVQPLPEALLHALRGQTH
jgi:acyl-CoA thioester hydrolase